MILEQIFIPSYWSSKRGGKKKIEMLYYLLKKKLKGYVAAGSVKLLHEFAGILRPGKSKHLRKIA